MALSLEMLMVVSSPLIVKTSWTPVSLLEASSTSENLHLIPAKVLKYLTEQYLTHEVPARKRRKVRGNGGQQKKGEETR